MTVSNVKNNVSLAIKYSAGTNDDGSAIIKTQKFSMVSKDASDENVYSVGKAIGDILSGSCLDIKRIDDCSLVEKA